MVRVSLCSMAALVILAAGLARADETQKNDAQKNDKQDKQRVQATISKVDADKDAITVKMMDKNGKEQEKTWQLSKDAKILDGSGQTAKLNAFHHGDDVLIKQKDDKVTELRKHAKASITKVDAKAGTITVSMMDKDGKKVEKTFRLVEDSEYLDSSGRIAVLDVFKSGDEILVVESEGRIQGLKKAPTQATTGAKEDDKDSTKKPDKK